MNLEQFTEKLKEYSTQDRELISRAFLFAQEAHKEQKRQSGEPFFNHPLSVALSLVELNLDAQTISAALLHDVIEDTPITENQIKKEFGDDVAFLVSGVTKLEKIFYNPNKKYAENLRKMMLAMAKDLRVVFIKLADRLHNMQTVFALTFEQRQRMAQETMEIYAPLASRLGIRKFRNQLEDLSFQYLYPQEFEWVKKISQPFIEKGGEYLEKLRPLVLRELKEAGLEPIRIDYRVKHFWSIYNKLLHFDKDINKIFDIVAMRIILPTIGDCYMAMGIIHKLWRPVPGKIKDYISTPKPNGYKSLHTTVFCMNGKVTEFQIRTPQMQAEAEQGIAAHWFYEERGKKSKKYIKLPRKLTWVKQLQEWQSHNVNSREFLESLRLDFFQNRIFVFTPKGDVIDLPQNATPVDFAYEIHSDIGNHCVGAKINGKISPLDTPLKSQDIVEIIVNKSKKPSLSWLNFVKTADAKSKIKNFLKKSSATQIRKK
jgi:GTP pyrophosphokinase